MGRADVVVVGGGVIGLSAAYILAREGIQVVLLEERALGKGASWAGAGIIAPIGSRPGSSAIDLLRNWSACLFPELSRVLLEESGIDNGYIRSGGLDLALTEADEAQLSVSAAGWRGEGIEHERVEGANLAQIEPELTRSAAAGYFLPGRSQVRNPRHLQALRVAAENRGVQTREGVKVLGFVRGGTGAGSTIRAVRTAAGEIACATIVLAAGAWSEQLLAPLDVFVPTPPVKGEIVLLRNQTPKLRRIIEHGRRYLVPRADGRVLVGATELDAGFDDRPTAGAVRDLIDEAIRLCPFLAGAEVERAWAGLRPGNADGLPTIGKPAGIENLIIATGHRRAGIQLSPGTAEVVADLVLNRPPRLPLKDLEPGRKPVTQTHHALFRS